LCRSHFLTFLLGKKIPEFLKRGGNSVNASNGKGGKSEQKKEG
jgi:hypothetical protein